MTRALVLGMVVAALLFAAPRARMAVGQSSSLDRAVRDLEETVFKMEARLERLEALAAMRSPNVYDTAAIIEDDATSSPSAEIQWIMQFDGVEAVEADPAAHQELERLQRDVDALERQVQRQRQIVSSQSGSSGGGYSRSYRSNRVSRQGRASGELLADYETQYRQKKGELKRLERDVNEPRQIILGNWNGKVISLTTTNDVSRVLNRIDTGGYLTWTGRRIREDASSQEWVVTSITAVDAGDVPGR